MESKKRINLMEFSEQGLSLSSGTPVSQGGTQYKILYQLSPFYLQGPPCYIRSFNNSNRNVCLEFPIENHLIYFRFFLTFDQFILNTTKHRSIISNDHQFQSSCVFTETHVRLTTKVFEQSTLYFNEDQEPLDLSNFQEKDVVIPILYTKGLFLDAQQKLNYRWSIQQLIRVNRFVVS